ncbi:MAG: hypothetical protein OHK0048_07740 [Rhodoferax sp.]
MAWGLGCVCMAFYNGEIGLFSLLAQATSITRLQRISMRAPTTSAHWRFFRAGGFDQVRLDSAAELLAIDQLDQKLWVALACPTRGLEFPARTLQLVDADGDGFIRAPELIAAVRWAGARLSQPEVLAQGLPGVPLAAIRSDDDEGAALQAAAQDALAQAGIADGMVTVEAASAAQQRRAAQALAAWETQAEAAKPLGEATEAAHAALLAVQAKIDDWFVRCALAGFDTRAGEALNASADALNALSAATLSADAQAIAELPLAQVQAQAILPLSTGLNPAWQARMDAFVQAVVTPLLGAQTQLDAGQWQQIKDRMAPYGAWLAAKPDPNAQDDASVALEKLACYVRDLLALANNFVAFRDFYARMGPANFQVGTLYLDGRACELCVAVNDVARHAAMAGLSRLYLVYVDCVRGAEKRSVVAALTAGDVDQIMVGRNGVFYDRQGRDWNATITKLIENPISLRQAFFAPYKKAARLVADQLQKFAAGKAQAADAQLASVAQGATAKATDPAKAAAAKPAPTPFDIGKFVGIFAAIGLAVGALGTAVASLLASLLALRWWQMPLALLALMLLISGPSVIMAWFKLRTRNLGPILDANGWAVNARARINIPFGTALTQRAQLPEGAERSLTDPYAQPETPWGLYALLLIALAAGIGWKLGAF